MHYSSCLFQCSCLSGSRADNENAQSGELTVLTLVLSLFPSFAALNLTATVITLPLPVSLRKLKCLSMALWSKMLWIFIILSTRWHVTLKLGIKSVWNQGLASMFFVDYAVAQQNVTFSSVLSLSSCISWSSYHKNLLASSDYEGTVILWDGFTGQRSKVYQVPLCVRWRQMTFITLIPLSVGENFYKCP